MRPLISSLAIFCRTLPRCSSAGFASFLLGEAHSATVPAPLDSRESVGGMGFFAQDSWRATPKLTVNYGLRWDVFIPMHMGQNKISSFDPTIPNPGAGGRLGALSIYGVGALSRRWSARASTPDRRPWPPCRWSPHCWPACGPCDPGRSPAGDKSPIRSQNAASPGSAWSHARDCGSSGGVAPDGSVGERGRGGGSGDSAERLPAGECPRQQRLAGQGHLPAWLVRAHRTDEMKDATKSAASEADPHPIWWTLC